MPKIAYIERNFSDVVLRDIERANLVMEDYAAQGYELTLRGLYYQFVARGWLPENTQKQYDRLGEIINYGRLAGLIDWDHLVDQTRGMESNTHWDDPESILDGCARQFQLDKWEGQPYRPEVWVEKDALVGIVARACRELDVPWLSLRGYNSQSEMWRGAMRLKGYWEKDKQTPVVFHLGDHDPSGLDMSRDIQERLKMFCGFKVRVSRLALNFDQVQRYNPPPNFAKISDSRYKMYQSQYGTESWELDALEPAVMTGIIRDAVLRLLDRKKYDGLKAEERRHREMLKTAARRWDAVVELLESEEPEEEETDDETN